MNVVDLRSDTVTLPTAEMRESINAAELGDDSRDGDPTVRRLEALAAERTAKEAGLFVPSGTMGNLVALLAHTGRGGEVLLESRSHILRSELGGIAALAGLFHKPLPGDERGAIRPDALRSALSPELRPDRLATALVCLETSHNAAGGRVPSLTRMAEIRTMAHEAGAPVHVDGARLFNAAAHLGVGADAIAAHADSVTFCVSKGLSAPMGSLLVGDAAFIARARAFRRMLGGNLRQAGIAAAAGVVALETMVDRLVEDHRTAYSLAQMLQQIDESLADPSVSETNIVMVDTSATGRNAAWWIESLRARGILVGAMGDDGLRLVTHRHIGPGEVEAAVAAFRALLPGSEARFAMPLGARAGTGL